MKKAIFAIFAVAILAACGVGNNVQAAPLNENFTANPATTVFSVSDAAIVEKVGSGVNVTRAVAVGNPDGTFGGYAKSTIAYGDPTGSVWANFKAQASANGFFQTSSAQTKYFSAKNVLSFSCLSGSVSQFSYLFGTENVTDACAMFNAAKAVSN